MKIELSFNNREESFVLPINPQSVEILEGSLNEKVRILSLGEINLIGKRGLISLSISSFFPGEKSPFRKKSIKDASEYKSLILKWKRSGRPIRVIIPEAELNLPMAIENFTYTVTEGLEDIRYTIDLTEYRFLTANRITKKNTKSVQKTGLKERVDLKEKKSEYIVKKGDSLWSIAKRNLGDGSKYPLIYEANRELIDSRNQKASKYTIYEGQRLVIPK